MTGMSKSVLAAAALLALGACGGGGEETGGGGGGGATNTPPVANAGTDRMATLAASVSLDGQASSDADGNALTYTWRQTAGADVTGGAGTLSGVSPSFTAPEGVQTLEFELTVNDGTVNSPGDRVTVHVLEDAANALFVDATAGSDSSGDGSMANPLASISAAVARAGSSRGDIYLRSGDNITYDEAGSTLLMPSGTSLYGGYGADWVRDAQARKATVRTNSIGVRYTGVAHDTWVSGLAVLAAGSTNADEDVRGIAASGNGNGSARMTVEFNNVVTGDVGPGTAMDPGSSYGVYVSSMAFAAVRGNTITAGTGGAGANGSTGARGANGNNGSLGNRDGGRRASGGSGGPGANGGTGGERGGGINGNGGIGSAGNDGTAPRGGIVPGGDGGSAGSGNNADGGGAGGLGNQGGSGVPGAAGGGAGNGELSVAFAALRAGTGGNGGAGSGGGGGGGGEANNVGVVGGGGGGGGEGGGGGGGGTGGWGGGASVGVWLHAVAQSEVVDNTIVADTGGIGGTGGAGGSGGSGGAGASGAAGDSQSFLGSGGGGGDGRSGGAGGSGGRGGAGGGGPSFAVVFGPNVAASVAGNLLTSGSGGAGGSGSSNGNGGEGGFSFALYDLDPFDGVLPTLGDGNTFTVGNPGGGGAGSGIGSPGDPGRSGQRNW